MSNLFVSSVYDRGVANLERFYISTAQTYVVTRDWGIFLAQRTNDPNLYTPVNNAFLWLGDSVLGPEDSVCIFTGSGEARVVDRTDNTGKLYFGYWGFDTTKFADPSFVPTLLRLSDMIAPFIPPDVQQGVLPQTPGT